MSKDNSLLKSNTDWARLDQMGDEDIDLSDIPELTDEQLQALRPARQVLAERGMQYDAHGVHYVSIHHDDGSTSRHAIAPHGNAVLLDPDVQTYFPASESVNQPLRALIHLIPQPR